MSSFFPSLETFAKGTAATAAGLGTIGMGLLYYGQNFLIYPSAFPPGAREDVPVPSEFSLPYQDLILTTPDNVRIKAYLLVQRPNLNIHGETSVDWNEDVDGDGDKFAASRPTVLMFHGNGGNHGHRIPLAKIFFVKMRCNVLMLSYRGYGQSEGSPNEKGLQMDAQTALDYVLQHDKLAKGPIILYGQSIGGAVSIDLASKNPHAITGIILENTFLSLPQLIPSVFPILSRVTFLCHEKWESYLKVPRIPKSIPILLLGGVRDELVPRAHMQGLWTLIRERGRTSTPTPTSTPQKKTTVSAIAAGRAAAATEPTQPSAPADGDVQEEEKEPVSERDGKDRYVEFGAGTHNDTCVQPGYWTTVSEFVAGLAPMKDGTSEDDEDEKVF
ncbi:alpha/beta-hydrolase [Amylostereum chailletii]|nr:alpha/beta-hydrolase [Amylostereum chailletii]